MTFISNFAMEVNFLLYRSLYIKLMTLVRTSFYDYKLTSCYLNIARQDINLRVYGLYTLRLKYGNLHGNLSKFLPVCHQLNACMLW